MSIATEITRLQTAKADLKTAIEGKGVTVPSATLLDGYADLVDSIQTGGGGGIESGTFTPATNARTVSIAVSSQPTHLVFLTPRSNITGTDNTWKTYAHFFLNSTDGGFDIMRYGASNNSGQFRAADQYSYSDGVFTINLYGYLVPGVTYEWYSF